MTLHGGKARLNCSQQVIQDPVRHCFMKGAFVAKGPEVELETLQLHAKSIWNVANFDRREIRLPGEQAKASELRTIEGDFVVSLRCRVVERLELSDRCAGHRGCLLPCWARLRQALHPQCRVKAR